MNIFCISSDRMVCSSGNAEAIGDGVCDAGKLIAPFVPAWVCFALHCQDSKYILSTLVSGVVKHTVFQKVRNTCPNGDHLLGHLTHSSPSTLFHTRDLGVDRVASVM